MASEDVPELCDLLPLQPVSTKNVTFVPTAMKGHIVHQKRIAEWFRYRPGYKVHFLYFPGNTKDIPPEGDNIQCHLLDCGAMETMFAEQSAAFAGCGLDQSSEPVQQACVDFCMPKNPKPGQDNLLSWHAALIGAFKKAEPDIIICEATALGNFHWIVPWCNAHKIPLMSIRCPGIVEKGHGRRLLEECCVPPEEWRKVVPADKPVEISQTDNLGMRQGWSPEAVFNYTGITVKELKRRQNGAGSMWEIWDSFDTVGALGLGTKSGDSFSYSYMFWMTVGDSSGWGNDLYAGRMARMLGVSRSLYDLLRNELTITHMLDGPKTQDVFEVYPSPETLIENAVDETAFPSTHIFTMPLLPLLEPQENGLVQHGREHFDADCGIAPDLMDWLYSSEVPVVFIAFGTMVRMTKTMIERIVEALNGHPWRVLWALRKELQPLLGIPLDPGQWRVDSFVPQSEVLKCDQVKCFVSHCGMNSTLEALEAGVPLVCCPFFMDQYEWAWNVCKYRKAGEFIQKFGAPEEMRDAVYKVLWIPAYRENAVTCFKTMRLQSQKILEELGPGMEPPPALGVGTAVAGAMIMLLLASSGGGKCFKDEQRTQPTEMHDRMIALSTLVRDAAREAVKEAPPIQDIVMPQ